MTILKINELYKSLADAGLKKAQVKAILPEWWDDRAAKSDIGAWEFVMLVARRLSLDANSLSQGQIVPVGSVARPAFKHRRNIGNEAYIPSTMIAASLAEAIAAACVRKLVQFTPNPVAIREFIREHNNGIVDFDGLLAFCWEMGIPVISLPNLPTGMKKMDGAVFMLRDRPAIIIARKNDSRSWLNFILAHELGHYCLNHLAMGGSIIDADLKGDVETQSESQTDAQEREADAFALSLLGGTEADHVLAGWHPRMDGVSLAAQAYKDFKAAGSSPGHLVLRHAFRTKAWAEAQVGLRFLNEDFEAQQHLVEVLGRNIDLNLIAEDLQDLVMNVTGLANV